MSVYDATGTAISRTYTQLGGKGSDARLKFTAPADGDHYIGVSASAAGTGTYTVAVTKKGELSVIELGDITDDEKAVFREDEIDNDDAYYEFVLTETKLIEFALRQQEHNANLYIRDQQGNLLHSSQRVGRANEVVRASLETGTYYIHVQAQESGANTYVLRYGPTSLSTVATDPDATPGQSRPAQFFNGVARAGGVVDGSDDAVDYVSFTYSETKSVTLELTGGADVSELHRDIDMVLENSRGHTIAPSEERGKTPEFIEMVLQPGTYYVQLVAYEAGTSPYELVITESSAPQLSIGKTHAYENDEDPALVFPVTLDKAFSREITVKWATHDHQDATATVGVDFQASSGKLVFAPGETEKTAVVPILDDDIDDNGESVAVRLSDSRQAIITAEQAFGIIENEDIAGGVATDGTVAVDGEAVTSYIESSSDRDWFAVSLNAGTTYYIDMKGQSTLHGWLFDPLIILRDENGGDFADDPDTTDVELVKNDNGGSGRNARMVFTPGDGKGGTYFISAESAETRRTGTYTLSVSTSQDDCSAVNPITTLCTVQLGREPKRPGLTGEIEFDGDIDWFAVQGASPSINPILPGQWYEVVVTGTRRLGSPLPPYLDDLADVRDDEGTLQDPVLYGIANPILIGSTADDDSGEGNFARLVFQASLNYTHYIGVSGNLRNGETMGTYGLTIRETTARDDATANTGTKATIVVSEDTAGQANGAHLTRGHFETMGDEDWFKVLLTKDTEYRFDAVNNMENPTVTADTTHILGLFDSGGNLLDETKDSGGVPNGGGNSRFFYTPKLTCEVDSTTSMTCPYYVAMGPHPRWSTVRGSYLVGVRTETDDIQTYLVAPRKLRLHEEAKPVTLNGSPVPAQLEWPGDVDWFRFDIPDTEQALSRSYRFDIIAANPAGDGALTVGELVGIYQTAGAKRELINGEMVEVMNLYDPLRLDKPTQSAGVFQPTQAGTYYVRVHKSTSVGSWEMLTIGGYKVTLK